jgi:ATP-dependent RNA helicase RhlE
MSYYAYKSSTHNKRGTSGRPNARPRNAGQYIDPKRFVAVASPATKTSLDSQYTFADFALNDILKHNLATKGYQTTTPIQDQAIPAGLEGKDVIGLAGTGTGKTAAFALPVLQKLLTSPQSAAIIIAPTRELAQQIEDECRMLAKGSGLRGVLLIGGTSMGPQLRDLRDRPRIVIGTPGRIKDHLQRGTLHLNKFNLIVLDEVDRMLDMGFVHEVRSILDQASKVRQSFFFSATMDSKVRTLINTFTHDPVTISIENQPSGENVHQDVVRYQGSSDKIDQLHNILLQEKVDKTIIFDETQRSVERLHKELQNRGFAAESIHGGRSQGQRQRALGKFKKNEVKVLVATDVAARGLDVADVTHVINFSIPKAYDDYIHRIGRAGRAGNIGYAFTFVAN